MIDSQPGLGAMRELLERNGRTPRESAGQWKFRCPHHQDVNPSASFAAGDKRPVVMFCQACQATPEEILDDLGATEDERQLILGGRDPERVYEYRDEAGTPLFRVVRWPGKKFRQQRPDGRRGWINGAKGVRRVPYHLPEAIEDIRGGAALFVVEGEKDCEAVERLGLTATTNPMGAGKWRDDYAQLLREAPAVFILPDNDTEGARHAEAVAASFRSVGVADVRIVELPELPPKGDVSDWIQRRNGSANIGSELVERAEAAPMWTPKPSARAEPLPQLDVRIPLTDIGNAERLVARFGPDVRYVRSRQEWLVWGGSLWRRDERAELEQMAKQVARGIYTETERPVDADARKAIAKHAIASESNQRIRAMIERAAAEPGVSLLADELDRDPWLLNCENCTVDLRTGEMHPHRREDLCTKQAAAAYRPDATHELWDRFLERVLPNPEVRTFLQLAAGYSVSGDVREEILIFCYGATCSGKSTFTKALQGALGTYAATADFASFLRRRQEPAARNDIARLHDARFVLSLEVDQGKRLAEGLVKSVTGGDRIAARFLFRESFEFTPKFKLWLVANHRPHASGRDAALWRRILVVPFGVTLPEAERDPTLKEALTADPSARAAVLAWAVKGALAWRAAGLVRPAAVRRATDDYREACSDHLDEFITECLQIGTGRVTAADLRRRYVDWCKAREQRPVDQRDVADALRERGAVQANTGQARVWRNVSLGTGTPDTDASDASIHHLSRSENT